MTTYILDTVTFVLVSKRRFGHVPGTYIEEYYEDTIQVISPSSNPIAIIPNREESLQKALLLL